MGWVVTPTPRPLYPRERPGTHCTGGWVGLRAGLDRCGKSRLHRDSIPTDRQARSESLYRLSNSSLPAETRRSWYIPRIVFYDSYFIVQGVPLATEPGISLIILTSMKILQRNLNRSTFVVWEIKRNVSVVCVCSAPDCWDTEQLIFSCPIYKFCYSLCW